MPVLSFISPPIMKACFFFKVSYKLSENRLNVTIEMLTAGQSRAGDEDFGPALNSSMMVAGFFMYRTKNVTEQNIWVTMDCRIHIAYCRIFIVKEYN